VKRVAGRWSRKKSREVTQEESLSRKKSLEVTVYESREVREYFEKRQKITIKGFGRVTRQ